MLETLKDGSRYNIKNNILSNNYTLCCIFW